MPISTEKRPEGHERSSAPHASTRRDRSTDHFRSTEFDRAIASRERVASSGSTASTCHQPQRNYAPRGSALSTALKHHCSPTSRIHIHTTETCMTARETNQSAPHALYLGPPIFSEKRERERGHVANTLACDSVRRAFVPLSGARTDREIVESELYRAKERIWWPQSKENVDRRE